MLITDDNVIKLLILFRANKLECFFIILVGEGKGVDHLKFAPQEWAPTLLANVVRGLEKKIFKSKRSSLFVQSISDEGKCFITVTLVFNLIKILIILII